MANNWYYLRHSCYKNLGTPDLVDVSDYQIFDSNHVLLSTVKDQQIAKDIVAGIDALDTLKKISQFAPNYSNQQTDKQANEDIDRSSQIGKWSYHKELIPRIQAGAADQIVYNIYDIEKKFVASVQHEYMAQAIVNYVNKTIDKITDKNDINKAIKDWKEARNIPSTVETLAKQFEKIIATSNELIVNSVIEILKKEPIA